MVEYISNYRERMRELRHRDSLSQAGLAKRLGVSQSTVAGWEKRKSEPNIEMLRRMAVAFGVTVDYLIGIATEEDGHRGYDATPTECEILDSYREQPAEYQILICRLLKVDHPADP